MVSSLLVINASKRLLENGFLRNIAEFRHIGDLSNNKNKEPTSLFHHKDGTDLPSNLDCRHTVPILDHKLH
jgi:hypothetical protein